ncbi:MAG: DUF2088 domain-containing protein [Anaerolineae bacterium]|nr:DUF2088 domain-containing protein [Anaerolineae bacterium]
MSGVLRGWWRSWYDKEQFEFPLPDDWDLVEARMQGGPTLTDAEIEEKLAQPISTRQISHLARGRRDAVIAIDDLNRPTEAFRILPFVLKELNKGGIPDTQIQIIVSLGTHRPLTRIDLEKKVGVEILQRVRVYNHNPYLNLVHVGNTSFGTPILINGQFAAADLKLSLGMLAPHSYAGFSGGGKIVLPGLASWETVLTNHKPASKVLSGQVGQVAGNLRRAEIDEAAKLAGLEFSIITVSNQAGETAGIFCGDVNEAFRVGAEFAANIYATDIPTDADIGIFNAFPKDTELMQALNSLSAWNPGAGARDVVRPGGTIVVITYAAEGHGWLGLINPGGPLHHRRDKNPVYQKMLENRELHFMSPNLTQVMLQDHYPPQVRVYPDWTAMRAKLQERHLGGTRVAFFPCGPLQIGVNDLKLARTASLRQS